MNKYIFLPLLALLYACAEDRKPEIIIDSDPPKPVSDVRVTNIPGGAVLKYQLPDDEDLLFVKAAYSYKEGHRAEARSSLYCDSIKILGFGTEDERTVELSAVDRSKNESTPISAKIKPLEAPVSIIGKTIEIMPDFGGVHLYWQNPDRAEISVVLEKEDNNNEFVPVETFYSTMANGDVAARGMDTIPGNFRAYVQDRWENKSIITEATLTPLFEQLFDRLKFQALYIEGDEPMAWGWVLSQLFDGDLTTGFHTAQGTGRWPQWITFDMGIVGKISRIKVWQRDESGSWIFRHGNPKRFEIWGTNDVDNMEDWDAWTKMMECESVKPSGLPEGENSAEDLALIAAGEEFVCSPEAPAVRYLRMKVLENWSGGDFFHLMEIEVYGKIEN
ncbi:MAG: DUF4959 domain-containing protein [Tannerella sp.]|jgi:hypothetical protein|nr:DUF4959 domain-containing protein [Tannerella sp.]